MVTNNQPTGPRPQAENCGVLASSSVKDPNYQSLVVAADTFLAHEGAGNAGEGGVQEESRKIDTSLN